MPTRSRRFRSLPPVVAATLAAALALAHPVPARGDQRNEPAGARKLAPPRGASAGPQEAARADGPAGWWLGTAGVAAALALCGWASVAARRYRPAGAAGSTALRVVGRTSLSPKHAVYLLDVNGRVLVVGTGPQGPPALLAELTEPDDPGKGRVVPAPTPRFDHRLGDEA